MSPSFRYVSDMPVFLQFCGVVLHSIRSLWYWQRGSGCSLTNRKVSSLDGPTCDDNTLVKYCCSPVFEVGSVYILAVEELDDSIKYQAFKRFNIHFFIK